MDTLDLYGPFNSVLEITDDDHCKLGKSYDLIINDEFIPHAYSNRDISIH